MKNNNKLKDDIQVLSRIEKKVFDKACNKLTGGGWDSIIEYDSDWGWIILPAEYKPEITLRRIKLFPLNSLADFDKALKLQTRLKQHLVEVYPYKVFLGNKIALDDLLIPFKFLSKADFYFWSKFFKGKNFSLKTNSIGEATDLEVD